MAGPSLGGGDAPRGLAGGSGRPTCRDRKKGRRSARKGRRANLMIRIAISQAAFDAIASTCSICLARTASLVSSGCRSSRRWVRAAVFAAAVMAGAAASRTAAAGARRSAAARRAASGRRARSLRTSRRRTKAKDVAAGAAQQLEQIDHLLPPDDRSANSCSLSSNCARSELRARAIARSPRKEATCCGDSLPAGLIRFNRP
jgi:hypothetical protein